MSARLPLPDRREVLAASAAVAASRFIPTQAHAAAGLQVTQSARSKSTFRKPSLPNCTSA
jgi:hypothetical protein